MTLNDLRSALEAAPAEAPIVFRTAAGDIGGGYHVTELRRADVAGIDCGGRQAHWTEATVQLLDGHGGDHMAAGKLRGILDKSLSAIPGLGDADVRVEFAPGNDGLGLFEFAAPRRQDGRVVIALNEARAVCKPAQDMGAAFRARRAGACC